MCFSEKLDAAAGYQEEHGYVLVGYKVVMQAGPLLMACAPVMGIVHDWLERVFTRQDVEYARSQYDFKEKLCTRAPQRFADAIAHTFDENEHVIFEPRRLLRVTPGRHGFHVAATAESAAGTRAANPFGTQTRRTHRLRGGLRYDPAKPVPKYVETEVETEEVVNPPGVLVRVLVPEHAVDATNHAYAMMIIPPGERERRADIIACDAWNRDHRRTEAPPPSNPDAREATTARVYGHTLTQINGRPYLMPGMRGAS